MGPGKQVGCEVSMVSTRGSAMIMRFDHYRFSTTAHCSAGTLDGSSGPAATRMLQGGGDGAVVPSGGCSVRA
jgi:hypothetical protein